MFVRRAMATRTLSVLLVTALLAAACGAAEPSAPPEQRLGGDDFSRAGGCGDVFIYAVRADDAVALIIDWPGAASAAQAEGEFSRNVQLPLSDVIVRLQLGEFLSDGFCTDVVQEGRPAILYETEAFEGQVELTVVPEGADPLFPLGRADVILTDVLFEVDAGEGVEQWRIERLELQDIQVGWLPG